MIAKENSSAMTLIRILGYAGLNPFAVPV